MPSAAMHRARQAQTLKSLLAGTGEPADTQKESPARNANAA